MGNTKYYICLLFLFIFIDTGYAKENFKDKLSAAARQSDFATIENNIDKIDESDKNDILRLAVYACEISSPSTNVCVREENAKILVSLVRSGADINRIELKSKCPVRNCGTWQIYRAQTMLSLIKNFNPSALPGVMPYADKCIIALTQIQETDPSDKSYAAYLDFWRDNKCSIKNFKTYTYLLDEEKDREHVKEIGLSKESVKKIYGEPTVYEHPSEGEEILTYKYAEQEDIKYTVSGLNGEGKSVYVNEKALIFTVNRDVVTKVELKELSRTAANGNTQTTDFDALQKKASQQQGGKRRF